MYTAEFPKCCGINVIANFGNDGFATYPHTKEEIQKYIRPINKTKGLTLIALNEKQVVAFGDIVEAEGFKPLVENFFHPGHMSHITLYGRITFTEEEACKRIKEYEEREKLYFSMSRQTAFSIWRQESTLSVSTTRVPEQPMNADSLTNFGSYFQVIRR